MAKNKNKKFGPREWRRLGDEQPPIGKKVEFKSPKGFVTKGVRSEDNHYATERPITGKVLWRYLPVGKPIKIIVSMHGGTIQSVEVDPKHRIELDVVFLESSKYGTQENEFEVAGGEYDGEIVYTHMGTEPSTAKNIESVFKAAQERIAAAEKDRTAEKDENR